MHHQVTEYESSPVEATQSQLATIRDLAGATESIDLVQVVDADSGFDGMVPDPILETDLIERMEQENSVSP